MKVKRILVFGLPGSGKSVFSNKLGKVLKLPVHHLDRHFYIENWVERNREEFLQIQEKLVKEEAWIIDGNARSVLEVRFQRADIAIYFRYNRLICIYRMIKRMVSHDPEIKDMPKGCTKSISWKLVKYLWTFDAVINERLNGLCQKYPNVDFYIVRNDKECRTVLTKIQRESL